jgi:hypothetical protein
MVLVGALAWSLGLGCATVRSGRFEISKDDADVDFPKIKGRASFELHCPRSGLSLVTLDVDGDRASQVGVEGCSQRAVYVRRGEEWILNSSAK